MPDTPDNGGSRTSCASRIVKTYDGENQKIGTYYNFQAATSGTGASITAQNTNSPDTFCPLGWQLPYSGTGGDYYDKSKSWKYLIETTYHKQIAVRGVIVTEYPFSYITSGSYTFQRGLLFFMGVLAYYSSLTNASNSEFYRLNMDDSVINNFSEGHTKAGSFPLRCVNYFSIPHRRHGGRKSSEYDDSALSG